VNSDINYIYLETAAVFSLLAHDSSQTDEMTLCSDADVQQYHTTPAEKPPILVIRNATLLYPSVLDKLSGNQDT
jgi:hypothetical protein